MKRSENDDRHNIIGFGVGFAADPLLLPCRVNAAGGYGWSMQWRYRSSGGFSGRELETLVTSSAHTQALRTDRSYDLGSTGLKFGRGTGCSK